MALTGKGAADYERRRDIRKQELAKAPKTAESVGMSLIKMARQIPERGNFTEGDMKAKLLKARCMRLAGRAHVVGNTAFAFNRDGICTVLDQGNARLDFRVMLETLNGAVELNDDGIEVPLVPVVEAAAVSEPVASVDEVPVASNEPAVPADEASVELAEEELPGEEPAPVEAAPESKPAERTESSRRKPAKNK